MFYETGFTIYKKSQLNEDQVHFYTLRSSKHLQLVCKAFSNKMGVNFTDGLKKNHQVLQCV
jgi:hypothetical protein